mmetsp:Transcript_32850/g.50210  ORF Transcript_32850/g.50210 Transcript_32850/m.50210 type:complete len:97 (+) Transcript_32850:1148-1438(+)
MFHEPCVRDWFDSKNQEREQRCPLCNLALDITVLRKMKQAKDSETQGDVHGNQNSPFLPQPSSYNTSAQNQVTPLSLDNTAMKNPDNNATIIIPER